MKFIKKNYPFIAYFFLFALLFFTISVSAQEARFTVVLDAGHGGHDPGATGSFSKEKNINLSVVLELGALIEKKCKDVKVVYTRKTDRYLTLQERADIVNNNHADLFICIHTNASPSSAAYGAESYTLGLAKSKSNLDVAMRENSVILMEDNYKTKYQGFDPNSVDSYIMFEFMQDKYIDRSIDFSSKVQKQFVSYSRRFDRGVFQAGFWVLHRSACPSVLVELGFISNAAEQRYLNSEQGRNEMSSAIFNAFNDYKRIHDKKSGINAIMVSNIELPVKTQDTNQVAVTENIVEKTLKPEKNVQKDQEKPVSKQTEDKIKPDSNQLPVFKVQILVSTKKINSDSQFFKGLKNVEPFVEKSFYKYTVGNESDYSKIESIRKGILSKFPEAFIIGFIGDKKLSTSEINKYRK